MPRRASKPTEPEDANQAAFRVVRELTGDEQESRPLPPPPKKKNPAAVALGKLGAKKGGVARAASLSPDERRAIAKKAAAKRWGKRET